MSEMLGMRYNLLSHFENREDLENGARDQR